MRRIIAIISILTLLLLASCKTIEREVPVTIEHTTERVRLDVVRDTLYRHDSVTTFIKGDTVVIERWHTLKGVNLVTRVDTLTERVEVPVKVKEVVKVEKELTKWQKFRLNAFFWLVPVVLLFGLYLFRKPLLTLLKRHI